jgi:hypothetical protein
MKAKLINKLLNKNSVPLREQYLNRKKTRNYFHSDDELRHHQFSPDIIRVITLRMMRLVGHVTRMGETEIDTKILVGNPKRN